MLLILNTSLGKIENAIYNDSMQVLNIKNYNICLCNSNESNYCDKDICIRKSYKSYAESLLIEFDYISYFILSLGFFTTLYGAEHYIMGLFSHIIFFLYNFIKEVELFLNFNQYIYLYIFVAAIITGFIFLIFYSSSDSDEISKNKILKTLYGAILGFFLFKNIFYYIIIFVPIDRNVYIIFLFIFIILGIVGGIICYNFDISDKYFYIPCSIIPGSFYIIKGIGYIVGGYYSDIILIRFNFNFSKGKNFGSNGNYKEKIVLYICLQFFIILASTIYQIYLTKYKLNEKSDLTCKIPSSRQSLLKDETSDTSNKSIKSSKNIQNKNINNSINNNTTFINDSGTEGDESNYVWDQED